MKKINIYFFIIFFLLTGAKQSMAENIYSISGVIEKIDIQKQSFLIFTEEEEEKLIITDDKTYFVKDMKEATFNDFKTGDNILVSSKDVKNNEIKAKGLFDKSSAMMLITGQGTSMEYEGKIIDIKGDLFTVSSQYGLKKFKITQETALIKNLKSASLSEFAPGDEYYGRADFPGTQKNEPEILYPIYLKDPLSYINELLTVKHGPLILKGTVTDVDEGKLTFKIGENDVLTNKNTVMLVTENFRGLSELKDKEVLIYGVTYPLEGKTCVASAILMEKALPLVRSSLSRISTSEDEKIITGKIIEIKNKENKIYIENKQGKRLLLNLTECVIKDEKDKERKNITINYLRVGDIIEAHGYDTSRLATLLIKQKFKPSVSRYKGEVNIYFLTDLLGYISPGQTGGEEAYNFLSGNKKETVASTEAGGLSYFSSLYKKTSSGKKNNLLICNGNFLFGNPASESTGGKSVVECLNKLGVKVAVLGEQDFWIGKENVREAIKTAAFPIIGTNVVATGTNNTMEGLKPYTVIKYEGIKVGIIGIVNPDAPKLLPKSLLEGISIEETDKSLIKYYPKVEAESDIIIILANQDTYNNILLAGNFQNILPNTKKKPVLIIGGGGRIFTPPSEPLKNNDIFILEGGSKGRYLNYIGLGFSENFSDVSYTYKVNRISPSLVKKEDENLKKVIDSFISKIPSRYSEILGKSLKMITIVKNKNKPSPMGNLVTDAMIKASGADIAFISTIHLRKYIFEGNITYGDIYNVIPYDLKMRTIELTGKEIRDILEKSLSSDDILQVGGAKIVFKKDNPQGKKITEITIKGEQFNNNKTYRVAVTDFLSEGGEGYSVFTKGNIIQEGALIRDIFADYIREIKEIKDYPEKRIFIE